MDPVRVNNPREIFEADANNINEDTIDCGITALKCCNTPWCRKLGTTKTFLTVLSVFAVIQGISEKYVTISIQQAAMEHDYDRITIVWLLVTHGIMQGLFAIFIAYWGNRIHKIKWLCGMVIFQSVASMIVIIPTLTHQSLPSQSTFNIHSVNLLCESRTLLNFKIHEFSYSITTLVCLFVLQTAISFSFIAFYTLGLTYIDDMSLEHNSPALIAIALASKWIGYEFGSGLSLAVYRLAFGWWFGWAIISLLLIVVATFIALFPRQLLASMVRQAADTIIETATNSSQISLSRTKFVSDIAFHASILRLFRNKVLLLNIFATVLIETAFVNFTLQESSYLQSRFLLPADTSDVINNEWTSRMLIKFIQPFGVALAILTGGLIIAKAAPSPRKIVAWNLIVALVICLLFIAFIFLECSHNSIAGAHVKKLTTPFCSRHCFCDTDIRFTPVCPQNGVQTFYSPCHAGCTSDRIINGIRVFDNCTCGINSEIPIVSGIATEGACGYKNCQNFWIIFQVLYTFGAICMGSRLIGKILITIRSVLKQDIAIALGLELALGGLIIYLPGKFSYEFIANITCNYWSQNGQFCYLHNSHNFGNFINILSIILSSISVILEFIILFFVKNLKLYGYSVFITKPIELQAIEPPAIENNDAPETDSTNQPLLSNQITNQDNGSNSTPVNLLPLPLPAIDYPKPVATQTEIQPESMTKSFITSSATSSSIRRYSPVYKDALTSFPPGHIEELSMRLQSLNGHFQINLIGSDINPSVESDTNKEPELNVRNLESSISSMSGLTISTTNSPEMLKNKPNPAFSAETDL